jgi:glycosyltransferase involved in cell wall biosynthesis
VNTVPRLSIGLPVYNGEKYLGESLEALLGQTYEDFELIISDNASTDGTADVCRYYQRSDSRIHYFRQQRNIGAAGNHHFVFQEARGELFKWAAADDLYARDLLVRCVALLDDHPEAVLAHSWTAAFDDDGQVTQALEYPLTTDSASAPERFRSMLFGSGENDWGLIRADDQYGIIRSAVLRKIAPQNSFYHSDRVLMAEIALHGPFRQVPEWLYFRRDHAGRPQHSSPTIRRWCTNMDPRRANRAIHPTARLLGEFLWGYVAAIGRAPLSPADRRACYQLLARWIASHATPAVNRIVRGGMFKGETAAIPPPPASISLDAVVAGRERKQL